MNVTSTARVRQSVTMESESPMAKSLCSTRMLEGTVTKHRRPAASAREVATAKFKARQLITAHSCFPADLNASMCCAVDFVCFDFPHSSLEYVVAALSMVNKTLFGAELQTGRVERGELVVYFDDIRLLLYREGVPTRYTNYVRTLNIPGLYWCSRNMNELVRHC